MTAFVDNIQFVTELCCNCGIPFAMSADFQRRRREDRKDFYCPAGHPQHYIGKTEAEKLREEVERQRQMREAEQARAEKLRQERDQVSRAHRRMRTRVMNGVCPCCNRTFQNLLRHMQSEHAGEFNLRNVRAAFGMTQTDVAKEVGLQSGYVSLHERGRPVPSYAAERLEAWIDQHAGTASIREAGKE